MFVRWKSRERTKRGKPTGVTAKSAVLVESVRVEGKVRQRFVAHLGSIQVGREQCHGDRVYFWRGVGKTFGKLALSPGLQRQIELALHEVVPFPTKEGAAQAAAELAALESQIRRLM